MTASVNDDENTIPLGDNAQFTCNICQELLPRSRFSKKSVRKSTFICQVCRKSSTAQRVNQPVPSQRKHGSRSESGLQRRPNNWGYCDYVDKLFGMTCFADLVRLHVFTSAKDVSESMAALQAVKSVTDKGTICLCVGDGSTPRTAVLACYLQSWETVVSIDPALKDAWVGREPQGVRGLVGFQGTFQEYLASSNIDCSRSCSHLVILLVHSHARFIGPCSIGLVRAMFGSPPSTVVSLPCCTRFRHTQDLHFQPSIQYDDDCVFSACRTVQIWNYEEVGVQYVETTKLCGEIRSESRNKKGVNPSMKKPL